MGDGSDGANGRAKSRARVGRSTKAGAIILRINRASEMPPMVVVVSEVVRVVSGLLSTGRVCHLCDVQVATERLLDRPKVIGNTLRIENSRADSEMMIDEYRMRRACYVQHEILGQAYTVTAPVMLCEFARTSRSPRQD